MKIAVDKKELLEKLEENCAKHAAIFKEAAIGHRECVIKVLSARLEDIRCGKRISLYFGVTEPQDHTKDYDVAIAMVKMAVGDTVDLDRAQFQCYILDEWDWKRSFLHSNAHYSKTASDELER